MQHPSRHYGIRADGSKRYLSTSHTQGKNLIAAVRRLQASLDAPTSQLIVSPEIAVCLGLEPGLNGTWIPVLAPTVTTNPVQRWSRGAFLGFLYGSLGASLVGLVALAYLGVVTALSAA